MKKQKLDLIYALKSTNVYFQKYLLFLEPFKWFIHNTSISIFAVSSSGLLSPSRVFIPQALKKNLKILLPSKKLLTLRENLLQWKGFFFYTIIWIGFFSKKNNPPYQRLIKNFQIFVYHWICWPQIHFYERLLRKSTVGPTSYQTDNIFFSCHETEIRLKSWKASALLMFHPGTDHN